MALIAFLSLLISDLVGWALIMYSDGLVSKESLRADTVGAMVTGVVVRSYGWCLLWRLMVVLWSLVLGSRRMSNGGALVYWLELLWVLLPLLVHVVVVVVVVDLPVNITCNY